MAVLYELTVIGEAATHVPEEVRDRHPDPGCEGCVRLTVGADEHTETLIAALRDVAEQLGLRARPQSEVRA